MSVICGDGEFGYAAHAPYDRIIVTAGAWDVPPAWADQLAPGGRLVVPLRMRGLTRSIAFERGERCWRSRSVKECGFIPMQGAGGVAERNIFLGGDAGVVLRIDDGQPADEPALEGALDVSPVVSWTGVTSPNGYFEHLDFWLASLTGFCRVIVMSQAISNGLVAPIYPWGSMGVLDGGTFAYLTRQRTGEEGDAKWPPSELGICAYGPRGEELAERVAERIRVWEDEQGRTADLWIEVRPVDDDGEPSGQLVIDKRHNRVIVHTSRDASATV